MNEIEELIKKYEQTSPYKLTNTDISGVDKQMVVDDLRELLNKRELVEVPECVAEYLKSCKKLSLGHSLGRVIERTYSVDDELDMWIVCHSESFARAWLDGYTVSKEPKCHTLKLHTDFFDDVASGVKTFEIRKNDRDYHVGDYLVLREYDPIDDYSGNECKVKITYITDYAQQDGYVVLGIVPVEEEAE